MSTLVQKIESTPSCKLIFIDFFDTLVHRKVHPNYCLKLWAKFLIRELAINISTQELYTIRLDSLKYLSKKPKRNVLEIPYELIVEEVYNRLVNSNLLNDIDLADFNIIFEQCDYLSEVSVQFQNESNVNQLKTLKDKGYRIFLITDFFFSKKLITRILEFHQLLDVFEKTYVSADVLHSKESGTIYPFVLKDLNENAANVIMIGDNKKSDVLNSFKHGINSIHTKNLSHHRRNKINLLGNDEFQFEKICEDLEKRCRKSKLQFSEYIIHFYFFTERLYEKAIANRVNDLFFLAREGLFLKKLFDRYQELNQFSGIHKINTHYLKASRQSAQKLALKSITEEDFKDFGRIHGKMSLRQFLSWFLFSEDIINQIIIDLNIDGDKSHSNIFKTKIIEKLKANTTFAAEFESTRINQQNAFHKYLDAFGSNYKEEGISLVDVGWGGTMQESLYHFLEEKIPVTGYYLGLKEIYNILPDTKRYGLNFSIYPNQDRSFDILKANGQLYEQLLAAPHGSTLGYTLSNDLADTIEFHEPSEKYVFDNYIFEIQEYMFKEFSELFQQLNTLDYSQDLTQKYMTNMALRSGLLGNKKQIQFVENLSKGFYQNVGENKVGLNYKPSQLGMPKRNFLKKFLISPEKVFRYLVKIKPFMYSKGVYWLSWPLHMAYYYMKFNFWFKKKFFPKDLLR